jgi:hypothetical protein
MNHMVASSQDRSAVALETNGRHTAVFRDHDRREDGTVFVDRKTNQSFVAGFSMQDALWRTNHAYDPDIRRENTHLPGSPRDDSMIRYLLLKDEFSKYSHN